MLFPQVETADWIKLYDLQVPVAFCRKCGLEQKFFIPFANKVFRGLLSTHLDCGEEYRQAVFVSVDAGERRALAEAIRQLSCHAL